MFDSSQTGRGDEQHLPKGKLELMPSVPPKRNSLCVVAALIFSLESWSYAQTLSLNGPAAVNSVKPAPVSEGIFTNLPFKLSISADAGYDDNVFTTHSDRIGSGYNDFSLDVGSHVGNQRSRLDGDLALGFEYYWDVPGRSLEPAPLK